MDRIILHSDLNNFYASVEAVKNPLLKGKAFAVAGDPEKRHGIILAKSRAAKAQGVTTGEAIWQARQKCPDLLLVPPDMRAYHHYSKLVRRIYAQFTDQIEPFGIDEAWLDVTASTRLFGGGAEIADQIRRRVREELGLTVSIGVSYNKVFAKLGSDLKKPDATTVISRENFSRVVHPLPVSSLLFVGRSTREKLAQYGIHTVRQAAEADPAFLTHILGKFGADLYQYAIGSPSAPLAEAQPVQSVSNSVTPAQDMKSPKEARLHLMMLAERVAARMREQALTGSLATLYVRNSRFSVMTRQASLLLPTNCAPEIFNAAFSLLQAHYDFATPIRCIGLGMSRLEPDSGDFQLSIWDHGDGRLRERQLNRAVDHLRGRYGFSCITRAGCLYKRLKNYTLSDAPGAPLSLATLPGKKFF